MLDLHGWEFSGGCQLCSAFLLSKALFVISFFLDPGYFPVSSIMPKMEGVWENRSVGIKPHFTEGSIGLRY